MTHRLLNMCHLEIANGILAEHSAALVDGPPLEGLANAIAEKLQDTFDLGFKAAGGTIYPLNVVGESQR